MELNQVVATISVIIVIGIVLGIGAFIGGDIEDKTSDKNTLSSNQNILTETTETLSPVGDGITSLTATGKNQTWLEFDGVNDALTLTVTQSKATISLWFKNATTTEWNSIIMSDGNIYINGTLNNDWTFLPYFISGDIITIGKSDGLTFLDVDIDEFRVYETALNSTDVLTVYGEGR